MILADLRKESGNWSNVLSRSSETHSIETADFQQLKWITRAGNESLFDSASGAHKADLGVQAKSSLPRIGDRNTSEHMPARAAARYDEGFFHGIARFAAICLAVCGPARYSSSTPTANKSTEMAEPP